MEVVLPEPADFLVVAPVSEEIVVAPPSVDELAR
jgi:hypothetical protein